MFPEEWLRETAGETGFIERESRIDPTIMFWVLSLRKTVNEYIEQISGKDIDAIVKIVLKRRAYKGKQKNDEMKVRLVAVYNEEEEKYNIYITNIKHMLWIF